MPNFYFHLHDSLDVCDEEGRDLPDLEAARAHAMRMARFELAEAAKIEARVVLSHRIDIADEQGTLLASVRFRDAVKVDP